MATVLRAARATDALFVATVLEMAGRGHLPRGPWDLAFPDAEERWRALAYLARDASRSWCHHALFDVAEVDGAPGAALVAFEPEELGDTSLGKPMFEVIAQLGWPPDRMAALGPLLAPYLRCFPGMPHGTWIVENVGTRADLRRKGLVAALIERALERGHDRGFRTAQISCLIGNDAAQRAYEKAGFAVVEELRDAEFERMFGAPGFSRMTQTL
jgi:ribosomal protein S18 acetylase RimI-like enzyme